MTPQTVEPNSLTADQLDEAVVTAQHGGTVFEPVNHDDQHDHGKREEHEHHYRVQTADIVRIALVAVAAAAVWFKVWEPFAKFSLIGIAATLIGGYPIFKEALENILERRMTMELSMTIALVAAMLIGEFFTALIIALFVLVAEVLEGLTVGRGRQAIQDMLDFLPRTAIRIRSGKHEEVELAKIVQGDVVLVKPGSRIPVDGTVSAGHSFVDQSAITGEPIPVEKTASGQVFAGTINQSGALEVRAERLGRDTTFGKIIEAVEKAERSRAYPKNSRSSGWLPGLLCSRRRDTHIFDHSQHSLNYFRNHRRWRVWNRCRNSSGDPRCDRPGCTSGCNYQRRPLSRSAGRYQPGTAR